MTVLLGNVVKTRITGVTSVTNPRKALPCKTIQTYPSRQTAPATLPRSHAPGPLPAPRYPRNQTQRSAAKASGAVSRAMKSI